MPIYPPPPYQAPSPWDVLKKIATRAAGGLSAKVLPIVANKAFGAQVGGVGGGARGSVAAAISDGYKPHTGDFMPNRQSPGISNINTPVKTAAEERGQFGERRVQDAIERAPFDDPTVEQPQQPEQPQQGGVDMGAILAEKNRQRMMEIMNERMLANAAQINAIKPYAHYEVAPDPRQLGQDLITTGVRDFGKNIQAAMGQIGKTLNANADRVTAGKIAYAPVEAARVKAQALRDIFNKLS